MRKELTALADRFREALEARAAAPPAPAPAPAPVAAPATPAAPSPAPEKKAAKEPAKAPAKEPAKAPAKATPPGIAATTGHQVRFEIQPKVKCDLLAYSGLNCSGQLMLVRVQPRGKADGEIDGDAFGSIMIAGAYGVRVTFATHDGDDWESYPWRSVVLVKGHSFKARTGKPAVRVLDLDHLDRPDGRRAATEFQESYPIAKSQDTGEGWTFGKPGAIRNHVRVVFVDKI